MDTIEEKLIRNLEDAGCDHQMIENFLKAEINHNQEYQLCLLSRHRRVLLDKIHESQKKLDCLDYLLYKMKSNTK